MVAPDGRYLKSFRTNEPLRIIDGRPIPNIIGSVERGWYLAMLMGLGYVPRDLVSRILITLDRTTKRLDSALGQQARRFREDHGGIDLNTTEHGAVVKYIAAMFWNEDGTVKATDEQLRRNTMAKLSDDGTRRWHKNTWILAPPSVEPTGDKLKVINQCLRKYPLPRPTVRTPMIEKEDVEDEEVWQKAKDKIVSQVFKDVDFTDPAQLAERKAGTLTTKPKHKRRIQKIAAEDDDNEDEEGSPKMEKRYPTRDRKRSSRALAIEEDASESSNSEQEPSEKEEVEEPLEQVRDLRRTGGASAVCSHNDR